MIACVGIQGQSAAEAALATSSDADVEWASLLASIQRTPLHLGSPNPKRSTTGGRRDEEITLVLDLVSQLRAFHTRHPSHVSARNSKRIEALSLMWVAWNGSAVQDERRTQLVEEIRGDPGFSSVQRFEVVAWSQQVDIFRRGLVTRADRLTAYEEAARALIKEFPDVADGFESLLAVARDGAVARGRSIARELLASSAPPSIKAGAELLLERLDLSGKPIDLLFSGADITELPAGRDGKVTVIYSWSSLVPESLNAAKRLAERAPDSVFIGICLDSDASHAREVAMTMSLPGKQYTDSRGVIGPLPRTLGMNEPGMVYIVDKNGVLGDLQGRADFATKLEHLK